jgi:acyl-ACP thioesterase
MVPLPTGGRTFAASRVVRLGDVSPRGRLRLDALVRYLQDVADDDVQDAGFAGSMAWVVRRTELDVARFPVLGEVIDVTTWCSGTGPRWAERRTELRGDLGGEADAVSVWVHVDTAGRPAVLPPVFYDVYGPSAGGRRASTRLRHRDPLPGAVAGEQAWVVRFADLDVLGHVNNAASWAAVEELLAPRRSLRAPLHAELEYHAAVEHGVPACLRWVDGSGGVRAWLVHDQQVLLSMEVEPWA